MSIRNRVHNLDISEDQLKIIIANLKASNITPDNIDDPLWAGSPNTIVKMLQELVDQPDDKYNRNLINGICM